MAAAKFRLVKFQVDLDASDDWFNFPFAEELCRGSALHSGDLTGAFNRTPLDFVRPCDVRKDYLVVFTWVKPEGQESIGWTLHPNIPPIWLKERVETNLWPMEG